MTRQFLLLCALLLLGSTAQAQERPEPEGLFGGFWLGLSQSNIDPDTETSAASLGNSLGMTVGWRWASGLGLSAGLSASSFIYDTTSVTGVGASGQPTLGEVEASLSADLLDLSAWYLWEASPDLLLSVRAGGGLMQGRHQIGFMGAEENAWGAIFSAGLVWRARPHLGVLADLSWKPSGLSFQEVSGLEDDLSMVTLSLGVGWIP